MYFSFNQYSATNKKNIKINEKCVYFEEFLINGLDCVRNLFESSGNMKPWIKVKEDFYLSESSKFQWLQLINALGTSWKKINIGRKSKFHHDKYI